MRFTPRCDAAWLRCQACMHDPYGSLVPIFRSVESRKRLIQHGTGILLKLNRKQYLLSAAHVFSGSTECRRFEET